MCMQWLLVLNDSISAIWCIEIESLQCAQRGYFKFKSDVDYSWCGLWLTIQAALSHGKHRKSVNFDMKNSNLGDCWCSGWSCDSSYPVTDLEVASTRGLYLKKSLRTDPTPRFLFVEEIISDFVTWGHGGRQNSVWILLLSDCPCP